MSIPALPLDRFDICTCGHMRRYHVNSTGGCTQACKCRGFVLSLTAIQRHRALPPPEAMHGAADGFGGSDFEPAFGLSDGEDRELRRQAAEHALPSVLPVVPIHGDRSQPAERRKFSVVIEDAPPAHKEGPRVLALRFDDAPPERRPDLPLEPLLAPRLTTGDVRKAKYERLLGLVARMFTLQEDMRRAEVLQSMAHLILGLRSDCLVGPGTKRLLDAITEYRQWAHEAYQAVMYELRFIVRSE